MSTVQAVLAGMKDKFRQAGIESPDLDARFLVQHALGMSQEELFLNSSKIISETEAITLNQYTERRLAHEPVSRIIGTRPFWKSEFKISKETLDPRQDSETVIETILKHPIPVKAKVLDLGTGTGCLLISLLQEFPEALGTGVDISADAIHTAQENARTLGVSSRTEFRATDWNSFTPEHPFDIVISNPPYIAENEIPGLAPEVRLHDPLRALVGGPDGLACYRDILSRLPDWLKPGGYVFFEIGHTQAEAVKDLLVRAGFSVLQTVPDLAGNDRCIAAQRLTP